MTLDNVKKIGGYLLPFLFTVVFLYFAFRNVDPDEVIEILQNSSVMYLTVFFVVFLFSHFIRAVRWKYILSSVKEDVSVWRLWGALMVGYGVNCAVPRLGEVYRGLFAGKWENLSRTSMLGTIVVERVIDLFVLLLSVVVSVLIYSGDLYERVEWLKPTVQVGLAGVIVLIIILYLVVRLQEKFYNIILRIVGKLSSRIAVKLGHLFKMFIEGFSTIKGSKNSLIIIFISIMIMVTYGLNSYIGFYVIHMNEIKEVTYAMGWIVMTISAFGIVIPTPGGTGSYHAINIFVVSEILGFPTEVGAAYAILTHLMSYIVFVSSMFVSIWLINRSMVKQGKPKENFISVVKMEKEAS